MFGYLQFIKIFDNFLLLNQGDLSVYSSYHFSTSNVLRLRCKKHIDFPMEISVLNFQAWQFGAKPRILRLLF